jgi:predicted transcriptional regulator
MPNVTPSTTIKVSRELHQRVAQAAERHGVTLAGAIAQAFDDAEEAEFWRGVRAMEPAEVQADAADFDGALRDGVGPADQADVSR